MEKNNLKHEIDDQQFTETTSSELHEIFNNKPNSIIRWGLTIILIASTLLLTISWFIEYPDLLQAKVLITTTPPPISIVTRSNGILHILKKENENVRIGDIIGFIQTNATPEAILQTEQQILADENIFKHKPGSLGDIEPYHATLLTALTSLSQFKENRAEEKQIEQLKKQIETYQKLARSLAKQQKLLAMELTLAQKKFATDSILFYQKVISAMDFNTAKTNWLQQQRNVRNSETSLINNEVQINQLNKQIADLEIQKAEHFQKLQLEVQQAKDQLLAQLRKWKETYTFITTRDGRLTYLDFLEDGQFIEANKPIFTIIPNEIKLIARAELPLRGSGKVKEGQNVNIRLENYPFEQFGLIKGNVLSISRNAGDDKYRVQIELPNQLLTTQGKRLPFKQSLSGTTEIITEDYRLLERFIQQLSGILSRK